ncbi:histidine phosphatase family protein [Streptomyces bohaiensis]|uniref:Histidine phosphatase family protein n=1 Tax=Streptomyces bohaiensis TaxID=1431344 RepID=A0ABX1CD51_9ACTN|nr:histidine phosphatase family protein [Streptomyces bohaiensis]NJQ15142.1 histidine phosphatase family protein [Streptomyces bohaiensis]
MTGSATRVLYLARHAEAAPDGAGLTDAGRRQAVLLGRRLRETPLTAIHHGPLPRAEETADLVGEQLGALPQYRSEAAGDYIPDTPAHEELPPTVAEPWTEFLNRITVEERETGSALAASAVEMFTGPVPGDEPRHELVVTHTFLIGWLVRAAMDAPKWRWMGMNHANAGLTVIRYAPDRPATVLLFNDTGHLPAGIRWTGLPPELRV